MSLSPVFLDVNSWVPAPILDAKPTRLLSEEEMNTLTRDFSRCFEGQTPSFTDVDGVFPYWMDNGWYNLSLPLSDAPSITENDVSDIFGFYFEAVRFSYGGQLDNTPGRFLGQNFSSEFGQLFTISPDRVAAGLSPQNCDVYTALMGQPMLPMEQKIAQDGGKTVLGDLLIAETALSGGMVVISASLVVLKPDVASSSTTSTGSTSPSTTSISSHSHKISRSGIIAALIGGVLALLFSLIGIFIWARRRRAHRRSTTTPVPPPIAPTSVIPSKISLAYSAMTSKSGSTQSSQPMRPTSATNNADADEEERVLRELRGAMATSGFTVNTLFARLAGPTEASGSGAPGQSPVPPAYDHRQ